MQNLFRHSGPGYFLLGLKLIWRPEIRAFLLLPILLNICLFGVTLGLLTHGLGHWMDGFLNNLPDWMSFVRWLLWPLIALCVLAVYGYGFNFITTLIGAPFYGLLAQKVQMVLGYPTPEDEPLGPLVRRTFHREWQKLCYFTPRSLILLIISGVALFIPGLNLAMPVVFFVWGAWCLAIQFCDYAADNQQVGFKDLQRQLGQRKALSLSFGGSCAGASMIPLFNILAIPAAVAGGTALWLECDKQTTPAGGQR
ncbi:MAG TPA: sulfate transporter CysZ [Cellvibrionaceae bacterium]